MARLRSGLMCLGLVLSGPLESAVAAEPAPLRIPGVEPVAALWEQFLAEARFDAVVAVYSATDAVYDEDGEVTAATCAAGDAPVQEGLRTVPVGLAVWYASWRCAEALGDTARAERDIAAFTALSQYAFERPLAATAVQPARIVHESDFYSLVLASGMSLRYAYYETGARERHLLLRASLVDPGNDREQLLALDWLDTWVRLNRHLPESEFAAFRFGVAERVLRTEHVADGTPLAASRLIRDAQGKPDPQSRLAAFESLALAGEVGAASVLAHACLRNSAQDCASRAIDALLPLVEEGLATPSAILAMAYLEGIGVGRDERAAAALVERVDTRLGNDIGTLMVASMWVSRSEGRMRPYPRFLRRRLERAAEGGDALATVFAVLGDMAGRGSKAPRRRDLERLREGAEGGDAMTLSVYADALEVLGESSAIEWRKRAAEAGSVLAQRNLALAYERGEGVPRDEQQSLRWRREAAHGGDRGSAHLLGMHYLRSGDIPRAKGWLESANMLGEREAAYEFARLMLGSREGASGDRTRGLAILRELVERYQHVKARHDLAGRLIRGEDGVADPGAGAAMLRENVRAGHMPSIVALGLGLLEGRLPAAEDEDATALLRRGADAGDADAQTALAMAIYRRRIAEAGSSAEALRLLRSAASADAMALNNLAWIRCTSTDPDYHDPVEGLTLAEELSAKPNLRPSQIDTIAACQAANGRFDDAIATQGEAIALVEDVPANAPALARFREVLEGYRRGEAVRESRDVPIGPAAHESSERTRD